MIEREMYYNEGTKEYTPIPHRVTTVHTEHLTFYVHRALSPFGDKQWQITEYVSGCSLSIYTRTRKEALDWIRKTIDDRISMEIRGKVSEVMSARLGESYDRL